jgi:hypothetical protein
MVISMALIAMAVCVCYIVAILLVFLSIWSLVFAYLNVVVLYLMLYLIVYSIPLNLNWSRNLYSSVFWSIVRYSIFCVFVYAGLYYVRGLTSIDGTEPQSIDYVYFSLTMWTNLGYSVFIPTQELRLLTVLEAVNGILTLPVLAAVIWLYCTFRIREEEKSAHGRGIRQAARAGTIGLDIERGVGVEYPTDKRKKAEAKRSASYALNPCANCGSDKLTIPRYWQIPGLTPFWFYMYPLFVVTCSKCGNLSDQSINIYLAVRSWNKLNPIRQEPVADRSEIE